MENQLSSKEVLNLSFENKFKIYMHYVATQSLIINQDVEVHIFKKTDEFLNKRKYPILKPNVRQIKSGFTKSIIRSFEDFCNEKDDRKSNGILGWYWRFFKEIKIEY